MTSLPLHPVMVHLPLALALLMPALAALAAWAVWSRRVGRRAWFAIVALQLVLVAASVVAIKTGEHEEDRVEAVVPEAALHQHEEYAEQFAWAGAVVLGLSVVVLVPGATRMFALATLLGTLAVAVLALRVGHAGGQLVYVHNAGAAYGSGTQRAGTPAETSDDTRRAAATRVRAERHADDDDRQ